MTTGCHSMSDPVTTPTGQTYWPHALITQTSHNFQPEEEEEGEKGGGGGGEMDKWCELGCAMSTIISGCGV